VPGIHKTPDRKRGKAARRLGFHKPFDMSGCCNQDCSLDRLHERQRGTLLIVLGINAAMFLYGCKLSIPRRKNEEDAMKIRTVAIFLLLLALSGYAPVSTFGAEAPRIEMDAFKARLGQPDVIVIDVRAATDWLLTREKIKGAVRENPKDFDKWHEKYPKGKTIVLYCA
jgi:hypothetical protein